MIDTPKIVETSPQITAMIHLTIPRAEIREVMGPGIGELMGTVAAQGINPTGPWFNHHLRMNPDTFDFEISVPVSSPVAPSGRVVPSELQARRVARTIYRGGYEGLGEAWGEFEEWIRENGHTSDEDLWEVYLAGPESSDNPSDWQTELNRPLAGVDQAG